MQTVKRVLFIIAMALIPSLTPVLAADDLKAIHYNAPFYDDSDGSSCTTSDVPASTNLTKAIVDAINLNKPDYVQASQTLDFPWQILAAIHYREHGFGRDNPSNGQGIFQFFSLSKAYAESKKTGADGGLSTDQLIRKYPLFPPGPVTGAELQRQLGLVVKTLHGKQASENYANHKTPISNASQDPDTIKDTLWRYNGADAYSKATAAKLGFSADTQGYEGSAYVMNQFDAKRMNMQVAYGDQTGQYGPDSNMGAFTMYSRLGGASGSSSSGCGVSGGGTVINVLHQELALHLASGASAPNGSSDTCGPRYLTGNPANAKYSGGGCEAWCADFASWVYKTAGTPLVGGVDGWRWSGTIAFSEYLKNKQIFVYNNPGSPPPQPGDLIFFDWSKGSGNQTNTGTSNQGIDHVAIVESFDGKTITYIGGNQSDGGKATVSRDTITLTSGPVVGYGRLK